MASDSFFVAGYHPYWTQDTWRGYDAHALNTLFFFEIEVAGDGSLLDTHGWPAAWKEMLGNMKERGVPVALTLTMHDHSAFERLFERASNVDALLHNVETLFKATPGLAGAQIDFEVFESVSSAAREGFSEFVTRLARRLRSIDGHLTVSAFVLAFDTDDAYDERAIADAVDYVVVQGYDFRTARSENAGPAAAISGWGRFNWNNLLARFDSLGIERRRIVMAVPLYGYEWPTESDTAGSPTRGEGIAVPLAAPARVLPALPRASDRIATFGMRRDPVSGAPYYVFRDSSGWHQGWIEDAQSLAAKYDFVRRNGLGGIALFPLSYGDAQMWSDMRRMFSTPRSRR